MAQVSARPRRAPLRASEKVAMENPAEWKPLERAIADALAAWTAANRDGSIGVSLPFAVATELRRRKIVDDSAEEAIGIKGLRQESDRNPPTPPDGAPAAP